MSKKTWLVLLSVFLFLYLFNYLSPLSMGDDYVYSFIWTGQSIYEPLPLNVQRVISWSNLFYSQWLHYVTWSGRTVAHFLAQFFLWKGKAFFNVVNTFVSLLLIFELYWCINKGKISLDFNYKAIIAIFLLLWICTPGFGVVFFWLTGACNYLWTSVILLGFFLLYVRKYYSTDKIIFENSMTTIILIFTFGVVAGWTNENSVCWILLLLAALIYECKKKQTLELWMCSGWAGLLIGYALLLLAPGNQIRFLEETNRTNWNFMMDLSKNIWTFILIMAFQFFLWYFLFRALYAINKLAIDSKLIRIDVLFIKILIYAGFGMTAVMFLSPSFPARSSFFGLLYLIIAAGAMLRIQDEYKLVLLQSSAKRFLLCIGTLFFVVTAGFTFRNYYSNYVQVEKLLSTVSSISVNKKDTVLVVDNIKLPSDHEDFYTTLHLLRFEISEDEQEWKNVAFARYYGIKGIRANHDRGDNHE